MKIKFACGSDDGVSLSDEHFGSAKFYMIFEMDLENRKISFLEKQMNNTPKEKIHGDPKKAKAVSTALKDVHVLLGFVFGPNIVRTRKRFVILISREKQINEVIKKLPNYIDNIKEEMKKENGIDKEIIRVI
jgi:hypothetical protein